MSRLHIVISNLATGGAELMLYKLLSRLDRRRFVPEITSLTDYTPLADKFRAIDVPVRSLGMRRGVPNPWAVVRLAALLRRTRPDLIQTWMYHADLLGGLAARLAGGVPVVWNIRHSTLDARSSKLLTRLTAHGCARLSRQLPARIVCCAETSRQVHLALGYDGARMEVIPNGFDLNAFAPDHVARDAVRRELGLGPETLLIGLVARFHPDKDQRTFVAAAAQLSQRGAAPHFLLCGDGITPENTELSGWIAAAGLAAHFHLLGRRNDMPRLTAALDIATSSSRSEGFSNTLGEALACAVPCVATDVGDSSLIVGAAGRLVPPGNPTALAAAWRELVELGAEGRRRLGAAGRERVVAAFSLDTIVGRYEELYAEVLRERQRRASPVSGEGQHDATPLG